MNITMVKRTKNDTDIQSIIHWIAISADMKKQNYGMDTVLFRDMDNGTVDIVATDGKRLHMATVPRAMLEGFGFHISENPREKWEPMKIYKRTKTETQFAGFANGQFPNYERVLPEYTKKIEFPRYNHDSAEARADIMQIFPILSVKAPVPLPMISLQYLADAFIMPIDRVYIAGEDWNTKALRFEAGDCTALIMPMQRPEGI